MDEIIDKKIIKPPNKNNIVKPIKNFSLKLKKKFNRKKVKRNIKFINNDIELILLNKFNKKKNIFKKKINFAN